MVIHYMNKDLNYSLLTNVVNAIFPLLTLPYILRIMTPNVYGVYVYANVTFMVCYTLFILSVLPYAVRQCALVLSSSEVYISDTLREIINLQFFLSLLAGFVHFLYYLFLKDNQTSIAVLCFLPCTFLTFINVDWYFFATQKYKQLFFRTVFVKSILLGFIFIFVKTKNDLFLYCILMALSYFVTNLIGIILIYKKVEWKKPDVFLAVKSFFGVKYFIANASIGVGYQYIDQLILAVFASKSDLAHLNIIKQMMGMANMIPSTICRFISPSAIKAYKFSDCRCHHKRYFKKYSFMVLVISIGMLLGGLPFLNLFAGKQFDFSILSVLFASIAIIMTSLAVYIDTQHSIPSNLEKATTISNAIVLPTSLCLLYPLFNALGYSGVILSFALGELLGVAVMLILHKFVYKSLSVSSNEKLG